MSEKLQLKYYLDELFLLSPDKGRWVNLNKKYNKQQLVDDYIKGLIRHQRGGVASIRDVNETYNEMRQDTAFYSTVAPHAINQEKIVFENGYYDYEGFHECERDKMEFSPFQIQRDFKEEVNDENKVKDFLLKFSGRDERKYKLLIEIAGAALIPDSMSIMPILYSSHSTSGKGTYVDLLSKMVGYQNRGQIDHSKFFGASSNFPLSAIKGKTLATMDELPHQLDTKASEKIKEYVDSKKFLFIERKGTNSEEILNTPTIIATTNKLVNIHNVDDAIKKRIIFVECTMNSDGKREFTSEQIRDMLNDEEGISWLINKACKAIFGVKEKTGIRNERFTATADTLKYWSHIETGSVVIDVIEKSNILSNLFDNKVDFWANGDLKDAFNNWKVENPEEKVSFAGFKRELQNYFSAKNLGTVMETRKAEGRGVEIQWSERSKEENTSFKKMNETVEIKLEDLEHIDLGDLI